MDLLPRHLVLDSNEDMPDPQLVGFVADLDDEAWPATVALTLSCRVPAKFAVFDAIKTDKTRKLVNA
jgi:hypothetical protein